MEKLPNRKPNRLPNYSYSNEGAYFITICAKEKKCIFGCGEELTSAGKIVREQVEKMTHFYPHVWIDKYVIMPNHVHLILVVEKEVVAKDPPNEMVPRFVGAIKRFSSQTAKISLWQRSYYDHVIRNEEDYRRIWQYIDTNPIKWNEDCYYAEG